MMVGILIAFSIGLFFGLKGRLKWLKKIKPVLWSTVLLLFFMGYEIGNDDTLISQIKEIGITALYIAVFSIVGSVLFTSIYEKFFKKEKSK
ncbi:LysO family transporter [Petrotoga mexicana]|nr:LysO family transporter [Petrotoga mexicana]